MWNKEGASLALVIPPAWYQTNWFRALCAFVFLTLLWIAHRIHVQRLHGQFDLVLDARVGERTRVARDLHDTLLQSFQGVLLKFNAVTYLLPEQPAEAQKALETTIEQARQAIIEGRNTVQGLRSHAVTISDLTQSLTLVGEQLAADQTSAKRTEFRVHVEGASRNLAPLVCDEIYRIAGEALRNAFRHSRAERVELEICYDLSQFSIRVCDDGKGIDPKILGGDEPRGHYGLPGMHERARVVGAKLTVRSEIDSGTEVELSIPAAVAYVKLPGARWPMFFRRGA